jgi:hypothetical protein
MIDAFPIFSHLSIELKDEIQRIANRFEPYSDFNFTSLFCWDTKLNTEVSILHNNLVIKLPEYITGEPVYSIIGDNNIDESLELLLRQTGQLKLVPECVINAITKDGQFNILEDRDNYDYIYNLEELVSFAGKKYKVKRNKANGFIRTFGHDLSLRNIRFGNKEDETVINSVLDDWAKERQRDTEETSNENFAIRRALENSRELNLTGFLVFINELCVGFSINEVVDRKYAICHFQKALLQYEHIDVFISNMAAKEMLHFGCAYINWEQDLGIQGLRDLKTSYQEHGFLKKYQVKLISGAL